MSSRALAYLIVGDDPYLVSQAISDILGETPGTAIEEFTLEADVGVILQALDTPSMFGDRRAVVVKNLDHCPAATHRRLISYLGSPNPDCLLLITSGKALPQVAAAVRKVGRLIEAGKGRRGELLAWVRGQAGRHGLRATGEGVEALVEAVGDERLALAQALEELGVSMGEGGRLGEEEVRRQFQGHADTRVYAFVDAVASRLTTAAMVHLRRLLLRGEAPQALFWTLARHFRLLLLARGAPERVADLRLPAWRTDKLLRQARRFSPEGLTRSYRILAGADRKMKLGEEPEALTLEKAVVAIGSN
ncbi:MAG: DNA polymerase III subunit delta [Actinomycetota bacterium]